MSAGRKAVLFPIVTVKTEEAIVVCKIEDAVFILFHIPALCAGVVNLPGIIDDVGNAQCILCSYRLQHTTQDSENK